MGLSSVFSTAVTGLNAAETTIDVVGNNIANSNTDGFKASQAIFATQFLQTLSLGSAASGNSGGTNPRQIGLGVQVAAITPDFTQGTLQISSSPSDLAIQGDGLFIVKSGSGEQLYTRNGKFQLNSQHQIVDITGDQLLGYGVDSNFNIQKTTLQPLSIPLGAASVAQATQNVYLEGTLTPTGDIANTAEIIQSGVLGDQTFTAPSAPVNVALAPVPLNTTAVASTAAAGALTPLGTYQYKVTFVDASGKESLASAASPATTLAGANNEILLNNIPTAPAGTYVARNIYRNIDGSATDFRLVGTINDNTTTVFDDKTVSNATLLTEPTMNTSTLTGNYSYYITFANAAGGPGNGIESRPTPLSGPLNVVNGRVELTNLPVDASGQWSQVRIYRNLSTNDADFHYVGEVANGTTAYTDTASDASITPNANIDLDGPRISNNTLLVNVLKRTDNTYTQLFQPGTLSFTGNKGGRALGTKTLTVTNTTTVLDLTNFMRDAMGIQTIPGPDPLNPIPGDISGKSPGGSVTANGQIQFVGNNGIENAISIGLSGLQLTTPSGTSPIDLQFGEAQKAVGQSAATDFVVYDSLGIPLNVHVTAVLQSRDGTKTTYRWFADSPDNDPLTGSDIAVGTGLITFDGQGKFLADTSSTVGIDRRHEPSASPMQFNLDFSQLSGLADTSASLAATRQDGFPPGKLTSFIVGEDGIIKGVFDNGTERDLGQIQLARFANNDGLQQRGQNLFAAGVNSGLPILGNPGQQGIGTIVAGALELSNTDIGKNLIELITASTQYKGNSRVISAADQLLQELLQLNR